MNPSSSYYYETPAKRYFSKRRMKYYIVNDSETSDENTTNKSSDDESDDQITHKEEHEEDLHEHDSSHEVQRDKHTREQVKHEHKNNNVISKDLTDIRRSNSRLAYQKYIQPRVQSPKTQISRPKLEIPKEKEAEVIEDPIPPMDWENYHRLNVIHNFMDELESTYPSICTVGFIGSSLEGRDLKILKVSNSDATNSSVWMDAGIHAREWIAPAVATYVANHIARNFNSLPEYVTNKDWYFLPVVNPDGYEYSHTVDRMWRKNRAWHGGQCLGVDLNRNFSYGWGGKGSSDNPFNSFYRGPEPFSEPESSAMRDFLSKSGISFKIYITLHSYGQIILFPFAFRDELCPDYVRLLEGATVMSKAIYDCNGNTYKVGISRDVLYGAAGTSNDWSYGAAKIPYCYLIELRSKKHKFKLPKEEIEETGNEILNCVKALMEFIDKREFHIKEAQI